MGCNIDAGDLTISRSLRAIGDITANYATISEYNQLKGLTKIYKLIITEKPEFNQFESDHLVGNGYFNLPIIISGIYNIKN